MTERVIIEIKLPVPVQELAAIAQALDKLHGSLFMRQAGELLQIVKPLEETK